MSARVSARLASMAFNRISSSQKAALLAAALLALPAGVSWGAGQSGSYTDTTSGGTWSNAANWQGGLVAGGNSGSIGTADSTTGNFSIAYFNTSTLTGPTTVHLDSSEAVSVLAFGDVGNTSGWTLDNNGSSGNSITLNANSYHGTPGGASPGTGSLPEIYIANQSVNITAQIAVTGNGYQGVAWEVAGNGTLSLNNSSDSWQGGLYMTGGGSLAAPLTFNVNIGSGTVVGSTNATVDYYSKNKIFIGQAGTDFLNLNIASGTINGSAITVGTASGGYATITVGALGGLNSGGEGGVGLAFPDNSSNAGTETLNVAGNVGLFNNSTITAGGYYGHALTINQTGGLFAFYSDNAGTVRGGTGYWYNRGSTQTLNLSGGTFSVPNLMFLGSAGGQGGGNTVINLNGGTLQPTASGSFVTNFNYSGSGLFASNSSGGLGTLTLNVQAGGGTLDSFGGSVTMNAPFLHSGTGTDGGITLNDSAATPGTLILTGSNTYTGPTTITRGTLALSAGTTIASSNAIKIAPAGTLDVSALSAPYTMLATQTISGAGAITGSLITAAGSTLTAGISGTGGALSISGPLSLNGGTTAFNLGFSSSGANGSINANGGLSVTAATTVDAVFSVLPVSSQTYVLFNYSGAALDSVSESDLSLSLAGSAAGYNAALFALNYNTAGQVDLVFTPASGASSNLIWASHSDGTWDVSTTANWTNQSSGSVANSTFHQGDNVTFDDTSGVQTAISLNTTVTPGSVSDTANSNNFSITGSGKISGATNLTMSGNGTLTIGTANDFTGTTFINSGTIIATNTAGSATGATGVIIASGGTLQLGDNATAGAGIVTGSITDNGSLVINRPDSSTLPVGITGTGSITFAGSGTTLISAQPGYSGATNISGGTVQYGLANALPFSTALNLSGTGTLNLANFGQTFNNAVTSSTGSNINLGTGNITFNTTAANILQGQITGNTSGGSIYLAGTSSVTLSNNVSTATLALANNNADNVTLNVAPGANITVGTLNVGNSGNANGGSGVINQTGGLIAAGTFTLAGTSTVTNGAIGTYNLSAGTLNVSTGFSTGQSQNSKAFINISGTGTINMLGNSTLLLGQYYGTPTVINQSGGLVQFASGSTGGIQINGESADVYNLSGGTLSVPKFTFGGQALTNSYGPTNPTLYFNGGILQASAASAGLFPADVFVTANGTQNAGGITGASAHFSTVVSTGGAIIDTDGNAVTLINNLAHDTTHLGSNPDGGLTLNDSASTPGVLTLNATNGYTGPTVITRGTLALGSSGSILSSPTIYVGTNGTFDVSAQSGYSPAASQFLMGVGTVTGLSSFSSGFITGGTNGSAGTLTFNTPLTLAGGTSLFDLADTSAGPNDLLVASGGLNVSGGSVIDAVFSTAPTSAQTYVLFNYSGSTLSSGAESLLSLSAAGSAGGVTVHNLGLSYTANQVLLTFTPGSSNAATLTWASTSSNSWDTSSSNWHNASIGGTGANSVFFNGDNVTFDDTTGVVTNIAINTAASPGSLTISSNTNNYNFSGSGTIAGATGLNKTGTSTLILGTSNSFTGPTDLAGGTTIAVNPAGSATGVTATTVESGATLQIGDGVTSGVGDVGGAITNNGTLLINRPDTFTFSGSVSGNAFVQEGAGTTILTGSSTYSGDTNIMAGKLQLGASNALPLGTNLNTGNAVGSGFNLASFNQTINDLNGGINSSLNLGSGTLTIGGGDNMTFAGPILGSASSQIILTVGANNYGGGTLNLSNNVSTGTLSIGPGDGDTENVNISAGNLNISNILLASGNATGGTANVVQSGGTVTTGHLQIGNASSIAGNIFTSYNLSGGTLNVSGTLNMATSQNVVTSTLTIGSGATLNMTGNNSIVMGDYYGSPASITQNGGTVAWTAANSSGGLQIDGGGTYGYTLNGGELSIPRIVWGGQASTSQYGTANATFEFNGGTLQILAPGVFFPSQVSVSTAHWTTTIGSGGATIDTAGNSVLFTNALVTDPSTGSDGGLNKIGAGTLTLSGSNTYNGLTNVSIGTLALTTSASLPIGGALNISDGATVTVPNHGGLSTVVPVVGNFSNLGTVDITNNAMRFTNSSEGAITAQVTAAYNGGNWNGSSALGIITSSTAAADSTHLTAIGISTGITSFENGTVNGSDVLVKYTYYGDATLDGSVTSADYTLIDNGFLTHATGWQNGDFNYDGVVNGSDYTLIDNAFNTQGAVIAAQIASPTAELSGGVASAVPEPTSLGLLTLAAMGLLGRRNRRRI